jgi:hypothetical protein
MISIKVPILPFNGLTLWRCDRDRPRDFLHRPPLVERDIFKISLRYLYIFLVSFFCWHLTDIF